MIDTRAKKLAKLVVNYCLEVKPNTKIIISSPTQAEEFTKELYKQIILAGANPHITMHPEGIDSFFFKHANIKQLKDFPKEELELMKHSKGYINVEVDDNTKELSNCDPKKIATRQKTMEKIEDLIFNGKKVGLKNVFVAYPCIAHAQQAEMSMEEWENFVYSACLIDWKKFAKKYEKITKLFHKGKEVHLIGEGVDLKFSIKNKNAVLDAGKENLPGGEIYMSPVKETLNGWIKFDYPSFYEGREIRNIALEFKKGKIIKATASKGEDFLKHAISLDKNSKYIGEFGIGVNEKIKKFVNNLLFDEKISGTVHLAIGMAYVENGGGNDSAIHWDIIKDMKKAKIILDGKVVQENGKWKL